MNEDFEIEIIDEKENLTSKNIEDNSSQNEVAEANEIDNNVQLPMNFITVGEIDNDDVKVYIKQSVFKNLEKYSSSDTDHELGSILVGEYTDAMGKSNIVISDYIEAKYTDASASTLTFTHESWDHIHKEHEEKYSDKKILGWQHTHPGYGIFLSNYDMFIQENFFNLPFQVAYVIDPKQKIRGFFQWKDGKVQKLKGYYIYDEIGESIKVDLSKPEEKKSIDASSKKLPSYITVVLALAIVFLAGMVFNLSSQIKKQSANQDQLESVVLQQNNEISALKSSQNSTTVAAEDEKTTLADYPNVSFIKYTVKSGDSLYSICEKNKIDFNTNLNIIKSINGLTDVNSIITGQIILLPCYEKEE